MKTWMITGTLLLGLGAATQAQAGVHAGLRINLTPVHYSHHHHHSWYRPYYGVAPVYYGPVYTRNIVYPAPVEVRTIYTQPVTTYSTSSYSIEPAPTVIYRDEIRTAPPITAPNEWLYCREPDGFYPAIKQCPGGWQKVAGGREN